MMIWRLMASVLVVSETGSVSLVSDNTDWPSEQACIRKHMMKIVLLLLILPTAAMAQQRTYYDGSGRVTGRAATDSQGSTTYYDASGRAAARSSTSGNTTTTYDAGGRVIERTYRSKR